MTDVASRSVAAPPAAAPPFAAPPFAAPRPRRTRRPSWLDFRLIAGVALVLVAVLGGAMVVSSADHRRPVWALSRDLPAGAVLRSSDLQPVNVQLGSTESAYVSSHEAVVGRAILRDGSAGELLGRSELTAPAQGVTVTLPIRSDNSPTLLRGDRITVWVTTKTCRALVVVSGVGVQDVKSSGSSAFGSSATAAVVLTLPSAQADRVITALDLDAAVLRVGVLAAGQNASDASAPLSQCESAK